jgi:hypothetical protein
MKKILTNKIYLEFKEKFKTDKFIIEELNKRGYKTSTGLKITDENILHYHTKSVWRPEILEKIKELAGLGFGSPRIEKELFDLGLFGANGGLIRRNTISMIIVENNIKRPRKIRKRPYKKIKKKPQNLNIPEHIVNFIIDTKKNSSIKPFGIVQKIKKTL